MTLSFSFPLPDDTLVAFVPLLTLLCTPSSPSFPARPLRASKEGVIVFAPLLVLLLPDEVDDMDLNEAVDVEDVVESVLSVEALRSRCPFSPFMLGVRPVVGGVGGIGALKVTVAVESLLFASLPNDSTLCPALSSPRRVDTALSYPLTPLSEWRENVESIEDDEEGERLFKGVANTSGFVGAPGFRIVPFWIMGVLAVGV
jgi:hypothetical protein